MANVEESDVAAECEYRKEKGVAKWHEKFLVEYRGGRKIQSAYFLYADSVATTYKIDYHLRIIHEMFS